MHAFKHYVFQFQVSMTNTMIVQMLDCAKNLLDNLGCSLFLKLPLLHLFKELTSFAQLSHKVEVILIHVDLVEVYNIGVINLHENVEFIFQHTDIRLDSISVNPLASKFFLWIRLFSYHAHNTESSRAKLLCCTFVDLTNILRAYSTIKMLLLEVTVTLSSFEE